MNLISLHNRDKLQPRVLQGPAEATKEVTRPVEYLVALALGVGVSIHVNGAAPGVSQTTLIGALLPSRVPHAVLLVPSHQVCIRTHPFRKVEITAGAQVFHLVVTGPVGPLLPLCQTNGISISDIKSHGLAADWQKSFSIELVDAVAGVEATPSRETSTHCSNSNRQI